MLHQIINSSDDAYPATLHAAGLSAFGTSSTSTCRQRAASNATALFGGAPPASAHDLLAGLLRPACALAATQAVLWVLTLGPLAHIGECRVRGGVEGGRCLSVLRDAGCWAWAGAC